MTNKGQYDLDIRVVVTTNLRVSLVVVAVVFVVENSKVTDGDIFHPTASINGTAMAKKLASGPFNDLTPGGTVLLLVVVIKIALLVRPE